MGYGVRPADALAVEAVELVAGGCGNRGFDEQSDGIAPRNQPVRMPHREDHETVLRTCRDRQLDADLDEIVRRRACHRGGRFEFGHRRDATQDRAGFNRGWHGSPTREKRFIKRGEFMGRETDAPPCPGGQGYSEW